jgi:hypothetical protein
MKWGIRKPSFRKRLAARTSFPRFVRHNRQLILTWGTVKIPARRKAAQLGQTKGREIGIACAFQGSVRARTQERGSCLIISKVGYL